MGDTLKREFSLDPVDTGRRQSMPPMTTPPFLPGGQGIPGIGNQSPQPAAPITRPSFLQAFLSNLGPALAGGLAAQPGAPFGTGLGGALGGIEEQRRYNQGFQLQQQNLQRQIAAQQSTQALQTAELQRMQQETPLDLQQKQMNIDLMKAQMGFYGNPDNLKNSADDAFNSLGTLSPAEQAQKDAATKDAQLKRSFDPISNAVKTISQDRITTARGEQAPDRQGLAAYLADPTIDKGIKNKNAATFIAWKAKQQPAAIMMGNILPAGDALDQQAQRYLQTGEMPPGLARSPGTTAAIIKRSAELDPNADISSNKAAFKANQASLQKLQTNFDAVNAFEQTAIKNLDQVAKTGGKIPDLGSRFANTPVREISAKMLGTKEMAAFRTALLTAQTEAAKVLSSATASGTLSDSARHETQDILDGNLPFPAMMASINQLKTDFANRHQSYQQQIDDIKGRLKGGNKQQGGERVIDLRQ